jgi:hypothetical protein
VDIDQTIPLVGQPYEVVTWNPIALILCNCGRDHGRLSLIHIFGFENHTGCHNCGRLYVLKGIRPTPEGKIAMVVDVVLPTPKGEVN